jgi:hypothetical protein
MIYTARNKFTKEMDGWSEYIKFSMLFQADEIVSLDGSLNESVFEYDINNELDFKYGIIIDMCVTNCYSNFNHVINRTIQNSNFNFLALTFEPKDDSSLISIENFSFIGFDLMDKSHGNSALTNCGGAPDVFEDNELNMFGLLDNFDRAKTIQKELYLTCPEDFHSDTNLWAIWRHDIIGK